AMNPCNSSTAVWEEVLTTEVTWIRLDLCIFPYSLQKSKRIAISIPLSSSMELDLVTTAIRKLPTSVTSQQRMNLNPNPASIH
ncbi:hypothetical protein, partial [Vacuolonema iberomarrocanum]|uniref:hypothetical protein n=1 Tax=Vacuolonema iberomarrocanum TaxID=3454632 RepID=UPI003F6DE34D